MMLPITEFPKVDGLAVYPDPTRASDTGGERGEAREATRVDGATYVLETEGSYTLPAIERSWWDVSAGRLREATIPSVTFDVAPNPDLAGEIALPEEPEGAAQAPASNETAPWWRRGGAPLLIPLALALLGGLVWRLGPALRTLLEDARRRRRESEEAHFGRILAACRRDDARATMRALLAWADRVTPTDQSPTLHRLLARAAEPELSQEVRALERALYGKEDALAWRGGPLARALVRARRVGRSGEARLAASRLAPLNPTT
jgi:hypothetical protein